MVLIQNKGKAGEKASLGQGTAGNITVAVCGLQQN